MLHLQHITYRHPDGNTLFDDIQLTLTRHDKVALIGNNGSGKSTLLQIAAGILMPVTGSVKASSNPYYIPQVLGQLGHLTVAEALGVAAKRKALQEIIGGNVTESRLVVLDDDWAVEERCLEALSSWKLPNISLDQSMSSLSGGEKTKVFLAGIQVHTPDIILMDEPTNHLDQESRQLLYHLVETFGGTLVVVSHDRHLLHLLSPVYELGQHGLTAYGGNYAFYLEQKSLETAADLDEVRSAETALRKAKIVNRETMERQQKLDARGKKKQEKAGLPTISMNTLRNNAERSTARIQGVHEGKIGAMGETLKNLRSQLPEPNSMRFDFDNSRLHTGKMLVRARGVNHNYGEGLLWAEPFQLELRSRDRVSLEGSNGSGKTTVIKMLLGDLKPASGTIERADAITVYIDQDYSLLQGDLTVAQQAALYNVKGLQPHEINNRLNRFLFNANDWGKPCRALSGGERMRLMLCCLSIGKRAPDIIVLDEPTNNLDIRNVEVLAAAVKEYTGTLVIVSHDSQFIGQVGVHHRVIMPPGGKR